MSDSPGAHVAISDVTLQYAHNATLALNHVSVNINPGETLVVLGSSGCGKSTLLRTINRLIVPDAGTISIDAVDVGKTDIVALRRSIGYVIQSAGLFPHLRVRENIAFVPTLLGWSRAKIDDRVDELLTLVRLDPASYRDRATTQLSGGEAQRVGVARALAAKPRLLLMDEPFGALDPVVRESLQNEIRNIIDGFGTTTVFVTHDVDEALRLADRIIVMHEGTILQDASPLDMLRAPIDARVAMLLGTQTLARRLSLVSIAGAMVKRAVDPNMPELNLPPDATLDLALNAFLAHPNTSSFRIGDDATLTFSDLAQAIASPTHA